MVTKTNNFERNLGPQPVAVIMGQLNLSGHDLVAASGEQLTHKMVARACKGRRLTAGAQVKVLNALNRASGKSYGLGDLFNY
ncbi:MAG: hypothetical protein A2Y07_05040 [Planctomycetes bacterium GWF2_50_10]|nr:MAG: hypothetical protein A2Y07_05040 [Planctomycetes bacterium GWF2_50_10]